jgi:hypothetical protein
MMLRYRLDGDCLVVDGEIDERATVSELTALLEAGRQVVGHKELKLDLSRVDGANSLGIRSWLMAVKAVRGPFCYVHMPEWLVEQCNIISEFMAGQIRVESLYAPFYCNDTQERRLLLVVVGRDIPLLQDYGSFMYPPVRLDGKIYEPDFDPVDLFGFLSRLKMRSSA